MDFALKERYGFLLRRKIIKKFLVIRLKSIKLLKSTINKLKYLLIYLFISEEIINFAV